MTAHIRDTYVLVLDTAMHACSVGLFSRGDQAITTHFSVSDPMTRGHQERIGPLVAEAIEQCGIQPAQIERIGVTLGPGSFTGLRVGLSFAKGLASGLSVPLHGFSTLEALAGAVCLKNRRRLAAYEAGRGQVYVQYVGADNVASPPQAVGLEGLSRLGHVYDPEIITGSGAALLATVFPQAESVGTALPDMSAMASLCFERPSDFTDLTPLYMREADAKVSDKAVIRFDF
ncbi:tRNA (adenosine(37)-N6)-threonylcarbamoyltransferase complex dimerization subunit type 1 TsaB [Asticcacaulis tiandongensis]|uniref:tRNA (adenosine(37)-N6)-threonylcarbamoyltransferase complex dimerization subunit type 1 TsaB n=1 Tax=Asticcacaulis tiandongensis TaxID=2565365 RepID=UPI00112C5D2A|nr:tRNA (adenosine(37)-N6)-threonylcarbamoyltransferase complex dimerization subunit type 1 TsaB [Asticcacaulis tiandongensis]